MFITLVGGTAAMWPLPDQAQQPSGGIKRVGVLMNRAASDPEGQARVAAFKAGMQQLGWNEGRNVRIDVGWGADDLDLEQKNATELIGLAPDVIFSAAMRGGCLATTFCRAGVQSTAK